MDNLAHIRSIAGITNPKELVVDGNHIFIADGTDGIVRHNLNTGNSRKKALASASCIAQFGNEVAVGTSSTDGKVYFYDKWTFKLHGEVALGAGVLTYGMAVKGNLLYVCCGGTFTGVKIINLYSKAVESRNVTTPVSVCHWRNYTILAVPSAATSIRMYDASWNLQVTKSPTERCYGLAVRDGILYAACRYGGTGYIYVYTIPDFTLKDTVSAIGDYALDSVDELELAGDILYVIHSGLATQHIDLLGSFEHEFTGDTEKDVFGTEELSFTTDDADEDTFETGGTSDTLTMVPDRVSSYPNAMVVDE